MKPFQRGDGKQKGNPCDKKGGFSNLKRKQHLAIIRQKDYKNMSESMRRRARKNTLATLVVAVLFRIAIRVVSTEIYVLTKVDVMCIQLLTWYRILIV